MTHAGAIVPNWMARCSIWRQKQEHQERWVDLICYAWRRTGEGKKHVPSGGNIMTALLKLHKQTPVRGSHRLIPAQGVLADSGGVWGGENQGGMRSSGRQCVCFIPVGQYQEPKADVGITRERVCAEIWPATCKTRKRNRGGTGPHILYSSRSKRVQTLKCTQSIRVKSLSLKDVCGQR